MIEFPVTQRAGQMGFERIDTVEDAVVKGLLTQIIPEVFDRVEFG